MNVMCLVKDRKDLSQLERSQMSLEENVVEITSEEVRDMIIEDLVKKIHTYIEKYCTDEESKNQVYDKLNKMDADDILVGIITNNVDSLREKIANAVFSEILKGLEQQSSSSATEGQPKGGAYEFTPQQMQRMPQQPQFVV